MLYHLKIYCVHADESDAPLVREVEPASGTRSNWMSSIAIHSAFADSVLIIRIRASWSPRG